MNREIKFRAWDNVEKKMNLTGTIGTGSGCQCIDIGFTGIMSLYNAYGLPDGSNPTFDKPVNERFKLMQYTGLKDKNGKEIYEGDIIGGYPHGTVTVRWFNEYACFGCYWIEKQEKEDTCEMINVEVTSLFTIELNNCEDDWIVLGNIYENPELL